MKPILRCLALVVALLSPLVAGGVSAFTPSAGGQFRERVIAFTDPIPAPDGQITTEDGEVIGLSAFDGEVSVITLWATTCHVCETEMPVLAKLSKRLDGANIAIRPITIDRPDMPTARIAAHMTQMGIADLPLLRDSSYEIWNRVGARGTPATIIVDRFGQVTAAVLGGYFDWLHDDVETYLHALAKAETAEASRLLLAPFTN